jgi:hypothetical protein
MERDETTDPIRDDDETGARAADDASGRGRVARETGGGDASDHPAGPSQPDDGFAEGADRKPDDADEKRMPDYARGVDAERDEGDLAEGRYSRGAEDAGTEEASPEGTFATGADEVPDK